VVVWKGNVILGATSFDPMASTWQTPGKDYSQYLILPKTDLLKRHRLDLSHLTDMACMIWRGTFGNGAVIGTESTPSPRS
jgi:hypothetical protein